MKTIFALIVLLALCLSSVAAPPPPLLYTRYTTNTTPVLDAFVVHASNGFATNPSFYGWVDWSSGNVTYVPLNGDIQTYVNNATAGDTLILASGVYTLTNTITITKALNIMGQGSAGFVTTPVTASHGTLITCTSNSFTAFRLLTNNVRVSDLSINLSGNTSTAISTGTNLVGFVFNKIDVIVACATGAAQGFVIKGSDAILRDLTFYVTSGNDSATGLYMYQDDTCTNANTVEAFNVTGTVKGGANWAYCFDCEGRGGTKPMTLNLDVCRGVTLAGTVDDTAVSSITSVGIDHSIVNGLFCTFDGADRDAYQSGTNQLNLGGSLTVNDRITGTVTYRAVMVAGKVTATNFTGNGQWLTNIASTNIVGQLALVNSTTEEPKLGNGIGQRQYSDRNALWDWWYFSNTNDAISAYRQMYRLSTSPSVVPVTNLVRWNSGGTAYITNRITSPGGAGYGGVSPTLKARLNLFCWITNVSGPAKLQAEVYQRSGANEIQLHSGTESASLTTYPTNIILDFSLTNPAVQINATNPIVIKVKVTGNLSPTNEFNWVVGGTYGSSFAWPLAGPVGDGSELNFTNPVFYGTVGIGAAPAGPALLEISNGALTNGYFWRSTNTGTGKGGGFATNGNFATSGRVSCTFVDCSTIESTGSGNFAQNVKVGLGFLMYWSGGAALDCQTNGVIRIGEYGMAQASGRDTNGGTLVFPKVSALLNPQRSTAWQGLTNVAWALANNAGTFQFMTTLDGTNRSDILKVSTNALTLSDVNNTLLVTLTNAGGVGLIRVASQMDSAQPLACFGALMMNSTNLNAFGASYTNVTGFDNVATNQFTAAAATGYLTNRIAGYYRATVNASFIGVNNGAYEGCLLTNGVDAEIISWKKTFDAASRMDCMSAHGVIYLPANTACSFGIKESTGAGDVAIHRASLIIGTP